MNPLEQIMGADDAAKLWGLSPSYIKDLCAHGKINAIKIGKTWIIDKNQPNPRKDDKKMNKLNELYALIEENGMKLGDAELQLEGQRIIIIDDNAESSDEAFVWEGYSVYEAYDFLKVNKYLEAL